MSAHLPAPVAGILFAAPDWPDRSLCLALRLRDCSDDDLVRTGESARLQGLRQLDIDIVWELIRRKSTGN